MMPVPVMPGARYEHITFAQPASAERAPGQRDSHSPRRPPIGPPARLSEADCAFLDDLFGRTGLDRGLYRQEVLARRMAACRRALRVESSQAAREAIQSGAHPPSAALNATLLGVTSFFRDAAVFDCLRDRILPQLAQSADPIRIWSAGCSEGAELYSVAILLADAGLLHRAELLGTDCRSDALEHARAGRFDSMTLRNVDQSTLHRHFMGDDAPRQVSDALRSSTTWRVANVVTCCEPGSWDLILCRNMAMYLADEATEALWNGLGGALRPGGFLVVGKAERPGHLRQRTLIPTRRGSSAAVVPFRAAESDWSGFGPCIYQRHCR